MVWALTCSSPPFVTDIVCVGDVYCSWSGFMIGILAPATVIGIVPLSYFRRVNYRNGLFFHAAVEFLGKCGLQLVCPHPIHFSPSLLFSLFGVTYQLSLVSSHRWAMHSAQLQFRLLPRCVYWPVRSQQWQRGSSPFDLPFGTLL